MYQKNIQHKRFLKGFTYKTKNLLHFQTNLKEEKNEKNN
jgi:hypothetical protein